MSRVDTPLSAIEGTPFSTFSTLSDPSTPQSFRRGPHGSPSPFPSTSRRSGGQSSHLMSMYSTQDRIALDIGARFIRAGFSGEAFPRCCIDAVSKSDKEVFWEEEGWDAGLIEDRLERGLREIYSQYLLIDSKTRKVIVAEPTLLPYKIKEAICRVMFTYFQVPSVTFLSSHVLALASTGMRTGLVIDIGWHDTRILPIYELRPLNAYVQVSPIACKALHSRVEYLLKHHTNPAWPSLSFTEVENFLIQALYTQPQPPQHRKTLTTGIIPNDELRNVYAPEVEDSIEYFVPSQRQKALVPRWICSSATEVFFEGDRKGVLPDLDEMGLASSTIACLQRLPKDVRAKVMQAVVVVGGGAAVPGFRTRLRNCLLSAWEENAKIVPRSNIQDEMVSGSRSLESNSASNGDSTSGKRGDTFKFLAANPLEATFLGASLLGDIKVRGLVEVTREGFNSSQGRGVMDWSFVGGIGEDEVEEGKRRSRG